MMKPEKTRAPNPPITTFDAGPNGKKTCNTVFCGTSVTTSEVLNWNGVS
jgi:hypothetical protein